MIVATARKDGTALHEAVRLVMADAAGQAIMPRFGRLAREEVREKARDELVTVADHQSEEILSEGLARILPEAAIIGEEAAAADRTVLDRLEEAHCWIIHTL